MTERNHPAGLRHPDDDLLLEVALGAVDPRIRHEVGTHLVGCARCRRAYDELAGSIERVLPAVPRIAPPPEFETAVLARLGGRRLDGRRAASGPDGATATPTAEASTSEGSASRGPASRESAAGELLTEALAGADRGQVPGVRRRAAPRWLVSVAAGLAGLVGGALIADVLRDPPAHTVSAGTPIVTGDGTRVGSIARTIADGEPALVVALEDGPVGASYTCRLVLTDGSVRDAGDWRLRADGVNSWVITDPGVRTVELVAESGLVWSSVEL